MAKEMKDFIAGWVGGATGIVVGQPLDTLKVRIATNPNNRSMIRSATQMIRKEGFFSLFKGTLAPSLGYGLCTGIQFYGCQIASRFFRHLLKRDRGELPMPCVALSGAFGGLLGGIALCPAELIKIQLQASTKKTSNIDVIRYIIERKGYLGFFKGLSSQLMRDTFGFAVYFGLYEWLIRRWGDSPWSILHAGGIVGMVSWSVIYPLDAVKSKLQATPFKPDAGWNKYRGFLHCFRSTFQKEGMRGLFRGFLPCFLRGYPVNAVTFFMYEYSLRLLVGEYKFRTKK